MTLCHLNIITCFWYYNFFLDLVFTRYYWPIDIIHVVRNLVPSIEFDKDDQRNSSGVNIPLALRRMESLVGSYGWSLDGISSTAGTGVE